MTFRILKRTPESAPSGGGRPTVAAPSLPPDLQEAAVRRLAIVGLLVASALVGLGLLEHRTAVVLGAAAGARGLGLVGLGAGALLSLAISLLCVRRTLAPARLLDLGLVYEVLAALAMAVNFHSVPLSAAAAPHGWSPVAVWIITYPLVVPSTAGKNVLATLAAAAMDPLGLLLAAVAGNPMPQAGLAWRMLLPTAVSAVLAIIVSRVVYRLSRQAGKALEMGSYRLVELLGKGGMGEVWRAEHRMLARPAAIKLIRPESSWTGGSVISHEQLQRFEREARATAILRSPHTVQVYDFGTTEEGVFYYVMELLEGFDLETLVGRFGPVPAERAVHILAQACHSLGEAHQGGFIHRDVKPANVFLCRYGIDWDFVKLLDFGLVKADALSEERQKNLTIEGVIAGTPAYLAPEVALGQRDLDWRADIYSLGCVGYWLLTGRPVFDGDSPLQIALAHANSPPVPASQRTDAIIPDPLDRLLLACLQKDPNNRPQSMPELAQALRAVPLTSPWNEERARRWWLRHTPERSAARPARSSAEAVRLVARGN